jgi:thioredoxin-related protein
MRSILLLSFLALFSMSCVAPETDADGWITNYESAFVQAKKEGKHVLINFTGSDWCGWCKRLDAEVFSQPKFKEYADKNLVLLKLDFPRRTPQSQAEKIRNQQLAQQFSVRGFPTILIVQSNQQVALRTGYQNGGVEKYINHIERVIN